LLENFADPEVGAVSGDLVLTNKPGVLRGVGAYWTFEKWLRRQESQVYATVGVTGAISAVRRELFQPIPPGVLLDDVYWPLHVVLQGYRVIHDERARAFDRLPDKAQDEFRRKVRTLAGNFQLLTRLPAALLPGVNPVWIQFVSHKLLRLVVPWALLTMLVLSALLPGMFYLAAFWLQVAFYTLGLGGMVAEPKPRGRLVAAASSFLVLNAAAFAAFWVWACGRASQSWTKVAYQPTPANIAWRFPVPREPEHADSAS
jgi:cellulose synthase/poly-beta-1,6-N-acetylglucosamine synthase-like glycosyltransferase